MVVIDGSDFCGAATDIFTTRKIRRTSSQEFPSPKNDGVERIVLPSQKKGGTGQKWFPVAERVKGRDGYGFSSSKE